MKKVLIVFLTVLMLITFVSCNDKNDKALEEAEKREQATIDFFETHNTVVYKYSPLSNQINVGEYDLAKYNSEESADADAKTAANKMIQKLLWANNIDYSSTDFKVTSAKGTVKITESPTTDSTVLSWVAKEVEIVYQYKDDDSKDVTGKISLSGDGFQKRTEDRITGILTIELVVKSFMSNGKIYRPIELTLERSSSDYEINKAICDGIELNKKMVKAALITE